VGVDLVFCAAKPTQRYRFVCLIFEFPLLVDLEQHTDGTMQFIETSLWKRAFGEPKLGTPEARLAESYFKFWRNACQLAEKIQADLPNLTLHNEAHFEALWRRADQICGEKVSLNPMEVFVLGGGILLHDLGLTLSAYKGGKTELQETPQWLDAVSRYLANTEKPNADLTPVQEKQALFETLRTIHAETASKLCDLSFRAGDTKVYLLEESQLRTHLGELIGEVAASHHWDIGRLEERFQKVIGSLDGYPEAWTIRPILIACLLRCADAVQLDQSRAPDFVYALVGPSGISDLHWNSQNRIAAPVVNPNDSSALMFSSTKPFEAEDAEAWWLLHDALQVANAELHGTNSLLKDLQLPGFAISRISNCESPRMLARSIRLKGWRPVAARVQISNVEKVVEQFGGAKLYGDSPVVALRELIQNAADAVRLRRALEPGNYDGKITVGLTSLQRATETEYRLYVEDDGLGMSEAVMSGPLIDFGSSYISSSLVKIERPGLVGKRQKLSGQYGIGFFSVFMLGDKVDVVSRPYDSGQVDCRILRFVDGIRKQPLLLEGKSEINSISCSTRVSVAMTAERFNSLMAYERNNAPTIQTSLDELVGSLLPNLEIDVWVEVQGTKSKVHDQNWSKRVDRGWLSRILCLNNAEVLKQNEGKKYSIEQFADLLEPIDPQNPFLGFAAIAPSAGCGVKTIGGLASTGGFHRFADEHLGFIEYLPGGPRRDIGRPVASSHLPDWASRQAIKLAGVELSEHQKFVAASRVAKFGGDATPIACMSLNRQTVSVYELAKRLCDGEIIYAPVAHRGIEENFELASFRRRQSGFIDNYRDDEIEFKASVLEPILEVHGGPFLIVPIKEKEEPTSFCALLSRLVMEKHYEIHLEGKRETDLAIYIGKSSERDNLEYGSPIECNCLKFSAKPRSA
jgi:hypothetical protein